MLLQLCYCLLNSELMLLLQYGVNFMTLVMNIVLLWELTMTESVLESVYYVLTWIAVYYVLTWKSVDHCDFVDHCVGINNNEFSVGISLLHGMHNTHRSRGLIVIMSTSIFYPQQFFYIELFLGSMKLFIFSKLIIYNKKLTLWYNIFVPIIELLSFVLIYHNIIFIYIYLHSSFFIQKSLYTTMKKKTIMKIMLNVYESQRYGKHHD